ncbi:MAG: hypothetical protein QM817_31125 [Archangium sp.]
MLRRLLTGLTAMPALLRRMRTNGDLWRAYLGLTLKRSVVVLILASPFIALRVEDLRDGDDDDDEEERVTGVVGTTWNWAVSLAGPLIAAQWLVVAFTREFDDRISDTLARTAGVTPEEAEPPKSPPQLRLEWKWLRKRMRRRLQVFLAALPGFILISFFFGLFPEDFMLRAITSAVGALWTFYWLVVGTVSKSASGWTTEGAAPPLLFIRGIAKVPFIGWLAKMWTRMAKAMFPPAEMVERHPLELAGLTLLRLTGVVPFVALVWRPIVPVAVSSIVQPVLSSHAESTRATSSQDS